MDLKDKSDAELNEACARIVGWKPTGLCRGISDGPRHHWRRCHKMYDIGVGTPHYCGSLEIDYGKNARPEGKCTLFEWSELPDYCNSAEAQAELEEWMLEISKVDFLQTTARRYLRVGDSHETWVEHRCKIRRQMSGRAASVTTKVSRGRALAEAFMQAFEEKNK